MFFMELPTFVKISLPLVATVVIPDDTKSLALLNPPDTAFPTLLFAILLPRFFTPLTAPDTTFEPNCFAPFQRFDAFSATPLPKFLIPFQALLTPSFTQLTTPDAPFLIPFHAPVTASYPRLNRDLFVLELYSLLVVDKSSNDIAS